MRRVAVVLVVFLAGSAAGWVVRGRVSGQERGYWTVLPPVDSDHNKRFPPGHKPVPARE